ncbi:D-alanine--poly(phosphoribitol) ligase [Trinickia fusca]|uniref:D-alanine--poly(Phosphoribitol) ligase n=1 Tax=Trinickia fusca TaxID=2419777 RepID=A0A494X026_9BURK|nr:D-alanine--poly(phosphoribitol) ligase [Trinickia fusca]RKP44128.1 D-alanine--poly(phosphoribitol) ligase [Trinickia fusca]
MRFDLMTSRFVEQTIRPDAPAVVGADRALSWRELEAEAAAWCDLAQAAGFAADLPVIVRGHKEASFFVAMAGALMLGAPFVPLDTIYPDARMQAIARTLEARVYFDARTGSFEPVPQADIPDTGTQATPARALRETGLAYVLFTSGTTGEPKGVQIGRESVQALVEWMEADFALGAAPVFLNQAPFSFDLAMYEVFGSLALGGTAVLSSRAASVPGPDFVERLATQGVDTWVSTPSFAQQHLLDPRFAQTSLPSMKTFLFCGEALPVALARRLRERFPAARIVNTYGPTEATVATTWIVVDDAVLAAHPERLPIGRAKRGAEVFVDEGELCVAGAHVMRGYLNRSDLNATRLFNRDGLRGFRTGDVGSIDPDGLLFCHGRIDDQIKVGGYRIELAEIDSALAVLPGGPRAAAVALRRPDGSVARIVAFVETGADDARPGQLPVPSDWKQQLAGRLPSYMIPSELIACRRLPVSINFKVDRARLAEDYRHAHFDSRGSKPGR